MFLCVFVLKTAAKPTKGSVYGDSRIPDDIGAGDVCGNCPAVGETASDGRRLRLRRSATVHAKNGRVERYKSGKVVEWRRRLMGMRKKSDGHQNAL